MSLGDSLRTQRFGMVLGATLIIAVMAAGCSGGGSKSSTPGTDSSGTSVATVAPELKAVTDKFAANTFKADYKLSSTGGDTPLDGTMTMYKDGSDKFRFDVKSTQDGQPVSITLIQTSDVSAFCLDNAGDLGSLLGVDSGSGVCFKNDPTNGAGDIQDLASTFKELSSVDTQVLDKSTRTIIGQSTQCYHYKNTQTGDTSDTCFSDEGVPLYDKTDSGSDSTTVEATTVAAEVGANDFNLPYVVKDFPNLGDSTP